MGSRGHTVLEVVEEFLSAMFSLHHHPLGMVRLRLSPHSGALCPLGWIGLPPSPRLPCPILCPQAICK
jgi:hypothetical protein